jgi:hypothetical protein
MTEKTLAEMDEGERLALLENMHRERVGTEGGFCYCAVSYPGSKVLWRLAFVERNDPGYYPITDDLFLGFEQTMKRKAAELNLKRLNLSSHEAAVIIASSMVGQQNDGRRR